MSSRDENAITFLNQPECPTVQKCQGSCAIFRAMDAGLENRPSPPFLETTALPAAEHSGSNAKTSTLESWQNQ